MVIDAKNRYHFYHLVRPRDSRLILLFMVLSLGIYMISWIYHVNKALETSDENAPESLRGFFILLLIPIAGLSFFYVLKYFFSENYLLEINILGAFFWSMFGFVSLNYMYDFFLSFGEMTKSPPLLWYLWIYPGYLSRILAFFGFYYTLPLLFFPIAAIPAMQGYLNNQINFYLEKEHHEIFNYKAQEIAKF